MDKSTPKTKICSSCGIRKPLDDFVVDPFKRHKEYSDICQACRGTKPDKEAPDDEGGAGGKQKSSGLDYFAKQFMEKLQKDWASKQKEKWSSDLIEERTEYESDELKKEKAEKADKKSPEKEKEKREAREKTESEETLTAEEKSEYEEKKASDKESAYHEAKDKLADTAGFETVKEARKIQRFFHPDAAEQKKRGGLLKQGGLRDLFSRSKETPSTKSDQTLNETHIQTDKQTQQDNKIIDTKQTEEITSSRLFRTEQHHVHQETKQQAAGSAAQQTLNIDMVEKYAKFHVSRSEPAPTQPTQQEPSTVQPKSRK